MQKKYRLKNNEDFNRVYRQGNSVANRQFVLYWLYREDVQHIRLGVSTSKKLGKAVVRNKVRRLVKEVIRLLLPSLEPHFDIVIIARYASVGLGFEETKKSLIHLLKKAGLLQKAA